MNNTNNYDNIVTYDTPPYKKRKRRFSDRKEGRRLKTIQPMAHVMPYIMPDRSDAQNYFDDSIDITNIQSYLDEKHKQGYTDMTLLHVILAAYTRIVSEKPGINRFVAGQKIYARKNIECVMVIKKELSLSAPDTCIKVELDPRDNIYNVYKKFQTTALGAIDKNTSFDNTARFIKKIPGFIFRFAMRIIKWLDYHGWLPKSLLNVSPFHGSMIITSMGSLGIPAIYHHIYNFGTLPVFISYGNVFYANKLNKDGTVERRRYVTLKVVTDERICDGFYYASAFKRLKKILQHPEILDDTLECVTEDID